MRLVIVSNRLPFTVVNGDDGPQFKVSSGGLTTGLWSYLERGAGGAEQRPGFVWLGWPGATVAPKDERAVRAYAEKEFKAVPVFLPEDKMDRFYHGFCNKTIWPLFHYFPDLTVYEEEYWEEYEQVNRMYADALLKVLKADDMLWVHDYQLMLVPAMIREKFPAMPIGFFLHIPFPSYEIFRLLPRVWGREIIEGLLGASLLGFHQIQIHGAGRQERLADGVGGDLVEHHPEDLDLGVAGPVELFLEVKADGFAFAVRIGRQVDRVHAGGSLPELGNQLLLALDDLVGWLEAVVHVHRQFLLGKVLDVAQGSFDDEVLA